MNNPIITLESFYNDYTLNIFTDASMDAQHAKSGCFGAVAINKNLLIDESYWYDNRLEDNDYTTSNYCEAKGLRLGINLAIRYARQFTYINIFSDSLLTVNTIRSYIGKWIYNNNLLYTSTNKPASNQEIHIENRILLDTLLSINPNIRIYHQNGHINERQSSSIDRAYYNFKLYNYIPNAIDIDINLIKYISRYNNYIDNATRRRLKDLIDTSIDYHDPIVFHATTKYTIPKLIPCKQII